MQTLTELRRLSADTLQIDEVIAYLAFAEGLKATYEKNSVDVPEWLDDRIRALKRDIHLKNADSLERKLREAKARRTQLLTADEKRKLLDAEIEELEAQRKTLGV